MRHPMAQVRLCTFATPMDMDFFTIRAIDMKYPNTCMLLFFYYNSV